MVKRQKRTQKGAAAVATASPEEMMTYLRQENQSLQEELFTKTSQIRSLRKRDIQFELLHEKHEKQVDTLEEQHEKEVSEMEDLHEKEYADLEGQHCKEMEELGEVQDRELELLDKKYDVFSESEEGGSDAN